MRTEQELRNCRMQMQAKGIELLEKSFEKKTDKYAKEMKAYAERIEFIDWILGKRRENKSPKSLFLEGYVDADGMTHTYCACGELIYCKAGKYKDGDCIRHHCKLEITERGE